MDIGDPDILEEGDIPPVMGRVEHLGVYVKLQKSAKAASNPETSHEDDDIILRVRSGELGKLLACCLGCIVDCVHIKFQT